MIELTRSDFNLKDVEEIAVVRTDVELVKSAWKDVCLITGDSPAPMPYPNYFDD
jgi:hypothetical protein